VSRRRRPLSGGGNGFGVFFLGLVKRRFCWGFWQKRGAERGFLMVDLWWIAGESW
jgi:hypothetical protein